jgi:hypothetical protein
VTIALVGLFDFLQNSGSIPLKDIPFVVDIGLALGWSLSHQPQMGRQIGRAIRHAGTDVPSPMAQPDAEYGAEHHARPSPNTPQQKYQAFSHQSNQQQSMPYQQT